MKLQILSDLHLETESYDPLPAPGAEALVLAGDIDSRWDGLARFAGWPVPVIFVAGNHEFDRRELRTAWPALRERCASLGLTMLERESLVLADAQGRRVRFLGTVRWSDFDLFGAAKREKVMRAARYFVEVMRSTLDGAPFDAAAVRAESLACRAWLEAELMRPRGDWDRTVVITHYGPGLRSADPRYGAQPGTASFCNADEDLVERADLWVHGHLHCRQDWRAGRGRVVSNARGHSARGEPRGHDPLFTVEV